MTYLNTTSQSIQKTNCPLCHFAFDSKEAACAGCPMFGGCGMSRCPNCHYEFTEDSKIYKWLEKIFKKGN